MDSMKTTSSNRIFLAFVLGILAGAAAMFCAGLLYLSAPLFGLASAVLTVLAVVVILAGSLTNGIILLVISLIGYSAMAGTVGGGGVGDIAIRYGYQQYKTEYLIVCSVILIAFVQAIQMLGNYMYKKMS